MTLCLLTIAIIGCKSVSEVVRIGPNLYTINASSAYTESQTKTSMLQKANEFAKDKGKVAEKVSLNEEQVVITNILLLELQFRLVDAP